MAGRTAGLCTATLTATAIGASRIFLNLHSAPEILLGAMIGITAVRLAGRPAISPQRAKALAVSAVLLIALLHGRRAPIEPVLVHIEHSLRSYA